MKPRSAKAKGTKLEKWVATALESVGWQSRRQPGSGIYSAFPHDVHAIDPMGDEWIVECKSWKDGWRTGDKAMGAADLLVIKRNFGEPCVYMKWETFAQLSAKIPSAEEAEQLAARVRGAGMQ